MPGRDSDLTHLLRQLGSGDRDADAAVLDLVYDRLKGVANRLFAGERADHTLHPTAIVHAAWQRLAREQGANWKARSQFFAVGATVMRRILVDHARGRVRQKRGGGAAAQSLSGIAAPDDHLHTDLLDLDEQLQQLAQLDPRQHQIVELRFFSGLTVAEVADVLDVSVRTVEAEWTMAKAWLRRQLARGLD
jgi:RNA polymerase sigma factor (TIGR02999 family)